MITRLRIVLGAFLVAAPAVVLMPVTGRAVDVIVFEELKEQALQYGKISQRFETCDVEPPWSIRVAFLKYARSKGASDKHIQILVEVFDEGQARVRNLKTGFSPEECKAKLESPRGQELLKQIEKWYHADAGKGS